MRFVSYHRGGVPGLAVEREGELRGLLSSEAGYPGDLEHLLSSGTLRQAAETLASGRALDRATLSYRTPLTRPGKILCIGLNYVDHAAETAMTPPDYPTVFARFGSGLVPHDAPLVVPRASALLDFEGEMAVVIGRTGREIPESQALDHVAGYSIFNDGSIRDYQMHTPQWTIGKNFDDTGGFGPVLVTPDELPRGAAGLRIRTRLNGAVMQDANTRDMIFDVARLISFISTAMTLEPGDVIVTGTPSGVGAARKPPVFMQSGDVCEVEVEGIGTLRNQIVAQP